MRAKILTTTIALALGLILPAAAYAQQSPQAQQPSSQQQSGYQQATERGETSIQVQQPAAEVTVTEQSPDVTVEQPQPEVRVRQREPQVTVQQPDPQVTVETAAPDVTVRETGEPDVRVQQRESQPDLRVTEDQDREDRQAEDRHDRELHLYDQGGPALVGPESGNDQTQQTERTATAASRIAALGSELVGKAIYGADDKKIGEVEDVVMGRGGDAEAVLTRVGGFLGIGSRQVALPVDRLQMDGDRITATDITKKEVENMPKYQGQNQPRPFFLSARTDRGPLPQRPYFVGISSLPLGFYFDTGGVTSVEDRGVVAGMTFARCHEDISTALILSDFEPYPPLRLYS